MWIYIWGKKQNKTQIKKHTHTQKPQTKTKKLQPTSWESCNTWGFITLIFLPQMNFVYINILKSLMSSSNFWDGNSQREYSSSSARQLEAVIDLVISFFFIYQERYQFNLTPASIKSTSVFLIRKPNLGLQLPWKQAAWLWILEVQAHTDL